MTETTGKPPATMPIRPMLVRTDVSRLRVNPLAFAGAARLHAFALRQGRAGVGCVDLPCRARAVEGIR